MMITYNNNFMDKSFPSLNLTPYIYRGADKSLARPGRKQDTATEDVDVYISYLL